MKKIITAWLLIAAFLSLSVTAYAQDQTTGSMEVTYEYTDTSGGDSGGGSDSGGGNESGEGDDSNGGDSDITTYTLNIPAHVTVTPNEAIPITATRNDVAEGKKIVITIDYDKTFSNGQFLLYKDKGEVNQESMYCRLWTYTDGTLSTLMMLERRDAQIASFAAGSLTPTGGGYMLIEPQGLESRSSGTYTGEIYFNISVEDM